MRFGNNVSLRSRNCICLGNGMKIVDVVRSFLVHVSFGGIHNYVVLAFDVLDACVLDIVPIDFLILVVTPNMVNTNIGETDVPMADRAILRTKLEVCHYWPVSSCTDVFINQLTLYYIT